MLFLSNFGIECCSRGWGVGDNRLLPCHPIGTGLYVSPPRNADMVGQHCTFRACFSRFDFNPRGTTTMMVSLYTAAASVI